MSIRLEIANSVARVTIDRPKVLNALDADAEQALEAIWQRLEADRDVRAVVLTGAGERAFCVGADLKAGGRSGLEYWAMARPAGFGGLALRSTLDIPVIARINGHALGGGFEMMLGCDLVIAAAEASFGLPEPRVGLLPLDGGMVLLQRQVPFRQAMGVLLTGRRFSAAEALAMVASSTKWSRTPSWIQRWSAGLVRSSPVRRCRCGQSSRRCGAPRI
jgi:crotonobetainyl-CoA hydratase